MLQILYGRKCIFSEISEQINRGVTDQILIVPQHYSHEAERRLCEVCGDSAALYCEVLTIKRLADRVFGIEGGLAGHVLDESGRLLAMKLAASSVSGKLKTFGAQINRPEYLQGLVAVVDEFKTYGISCEQLAKAVEEDTDLSGGKLEDISLIYSAYDAVLGQNVKDSADLPARLIEKLESGSYAEGKTFYIDSFTEFTPQEFAIVEVLLKKSTKLTVVFDVDPSLIDITAHTDSAFYGYVKSIERLRRSAKSFGIPVIEESRVQAEASDSRPDCIDFLRSNLFGDKVPQYDGECNAISLHTAADRWEEVEQAAAEIIRLCKEENYRFRDIVVAFPDYDSYAGIVEAVFEAWEIPVFSDRMDQIMKKNAMTAIDAALDTIVGNFSYGDIFRYLKTGLTNITYDECCRLENYAIAWNVQGNRWISDNEWTMNPRGFSESFDERAEAELKRINEIRFRVMTPFMNLVKVVPPKNLMPASEIILHFYNFLVEAGVDKEIAKKAYQYRERKELKLADEYSQLWSLICDALDTCYNILDDTPMDFSEFAGMFKLLLSSLTVGTIPVSLDSVAVGAAGRMRHRTPKCVLLLGACNGDFPPPVDTPSLLTDEDRDVLMSLGVSVSPPSSMLLYRSMDVAYSILTLAEERLYISWPETTQGAQRTPSFMVEIVREMFSLKVNPPIGDERFTYAKTPCFELALRSVMNESTEGEIFRTHDFSKAAYDYFKDKDEYKDRINSAVYCADSSRANLSKENVRKLYGDSILLTASRTDLLQSCKFAYFMRYGLRAKPRVKSGLDAPEAGTFLHYVLEKSIETIMERGGFSQVTTPEVRSIAETITENYSIDVLGGLSDKSARVRFLFRRLKRTAVRVVENVIEELKDSNFEPLALELYFGEGGQAPALSIGEDEERIELVGVVDRIDGWKKDDKLYIRVVDYKSGYKKFDLGDIWHGLNLQMFLYLFALEKIGKDIFGTETVGAGVLYVPVKDTVYSGSRGEDDEKIQKMIDESLRRSGLILRENEVVEAMESGNPKRFIPVSYARDGLAYTKRSSLANLEQLGKLKKHIEMLLRQMSRALHQGEIKADPYYRNSRNNACQYCDFLTACRFDKTNGKDQMRYLYSVKADDFWNRVGGDEDGN